MKKVTIYSTPTCTYCRHAKEFFKEKGIQFEEHDVSADAARRTEMIDLSGQMGVPVITIDNDLVIGFNKPVLSKLLGI
ncbi:MAG: Uxx-star family glutaredoxin-like (seleno)protein [Patescibacteria group bacterium]